jgi:hypothetical protein
MFFQIFPGFNLKVSPSALCAVPLLLTQGSQILSLALKSQRSYYSKVPFVAECNKSETLLKFIQITFKVTN